MSLASGKCAAPLLKKLSQNQLQCRKVLDQGKCSKPVENLPVTSTGHTSHKHPGTWNVDTTDHIKDHDDKTLIKGMGNTTVGSINKHLNLNKMTCARYLVKAENLQQIILTKPMTRVQAVGDQKGTLL